MARKKCKANSINKCILLLYSFFIYCSTFSQVNDLYLKFNQEQAKWKFEITADNENLFFGHFYNGYNESFFGFLSENNRVRFGIFNRNKTFLTSISYGVYDNQNFFGISHNKPNSYDDIYGIWSKNKLVNKLQYKPKNRKIKGRYLIRYANDDIYLGELKRGRRDGIGLYISNKGFVYYGEWDKDKCTGRKSSIIFPNGEGFRGSWVNQKISGYGKFYSEFVESTSQNWDLIGSDLYRDGKLYRENLLEYSTSNHIVSATIFERDITDKSLPIRNSYKINSAEAESNSRSSLEDKKPLRKKINWKEFESKYTSDERNDVKPSQELNKDSNTNTKSKSRDTKDSESQNGIWNNIKLVFIVIVIFGLMALSIYVAFNLFFYLLKLLASLFKAPSQKNNKIEISHSNGVNLRERTISSLFNKKYPENPSIFWVGDEHRNHPWSRKPGGSTVIVLLKRGYRKNGRRCLGYDKIKRPYEYTSKVSEDFISNHSSNVRLNLVEDYFEAIYLAEENSYDIQKVWHSNMGNNLESILSKYRSKNFN